MNFRFYIILCTFLMALLASPAFGQKTKQVRLNNKLLTDSTRQIAPKAEVAIDFPNVNKIPYYYDKKKLNAIRKHEKRKNWQKTLPLLEAYVGNFGIENFYKDTQLMWRLAQLYERTNRPDKAKAYYQMVLKHHRTDIKRVQLYYDSLEQKEKDYYVPLDYYYKLVEYRKNVTKFLPPKGVNVNMGYEINSKAEDYGPAVISENNQLIFTSKRGFRGLNAVPNEDLYYTKMVDGAWEEAQSFGKPINSIWNEGSACLTKDGKTLYFARCECPDCRGNCDLYIAHLLEDGTWGKIKNLGPEINSKAWDSQPTLSKNEDTLYFASDRLGGFGLSDIWFTYKQKNGKWAPAQNAGPVINTRENEVSPFFHPLYQVLYFSSRGQLLNFGDFDIYKTYRVNGRWQEPRNLGPLVNGKGSEYYFSIDGESKNLYYAKADPKEPKNLDLYSFPLPMEAHPLAVTHIEGVLTDSVSNKPLTGIISIIDLDNGVEVASKYIRPDGTFDFDLIDNTRYTMLIQSPDFFSVEKTFDLATDTVFQIMTTMIDHSLPLIFKNIEFDGGKWDIKKDMEPILDRIVLYLVDHPTFRLKIGGHTDSSGDPDLNLELSQKRADAIKRYLATKGKFSEDRIDSFGYGSTEPLKDEVTDEDMKINRRVEFKLLKPDNGQNQEQLQGWD
ncbi:OmpA family protein [Adhaeribacter terrigena]|nr:OmpA family protein [Adhaeribacter terrigena]